MSFVACAKGGGAGKSCSEQGPGAQSKAQEPLCSWLGGLKAKWAAGQSEDPTCWTR